MKTRITLFILLVLAGIAAADSTIDHIYTLFSQGDYIRAEKEFRGLPPSTIRDGNRLFVSALFEDHGDRARELLATAIQSNLDGKYMEEAYFRLIQLAEADGDTAEVVSRSSSFLKRWDNSRYREQILAVLAAHSVADEHEHDRYLDLLSDEYPGSYFGQYARLSKAYDAFDRGHFITATTLCRKINNSTDNNLTAASLIMLSRIALRQNQADRALLNFNILREQYTDAIGEGDLLVALKRISEAKSGEESTEVFEGITYSVQVGVFAEKDNAKNMEKRVEAYGYDARIKKRVISGNTYRVVLAGKFKTQQDAQVAKQKLELGENQIFKVVVNEEK